MSQTLLLGRTLRFTDDPFATGWQSACDIHETGGVLIEAGRIKATGDGPTRARPTRRPG